jgi:hypothetical protein
MAPGCLSTGIVGSNPAQAMYVCPRLSVLCCVLAVEALCYFDPTPDSPIKCRNG